MLLFDAIIFDAIIIIKPRNSCNSFLKFSISTANPNIPHNADDANHKADESHLLVLL